jgi:ethanolamine utilization microcompartment shell protein EutS
LSSHPLHFMMAKREMSNLVLLSLAAVAITMITSLPGETSGVAVDFTLAKAIARAVYFDNQHCTLYVRVDDMVRACVFKSFKSVLHLAIE